MTTTRLSGSDRLSDLRIGHRRCTICHRSCLAEGSIAWRRDMFHFAGAGETSLGGLFRCDLPSEAKNVGAHGRVWSIPASDYTTPRAVQFKAGLHRFAETFHHRAGAVTITCSCGQSLNELQLLINHQRNQTSKPGPILSKARRCRDLSLIAALYCSKNRPPHRMQMTT